MKKAHKFHCERCSNPCTVYKHGKGHRVFVCPTCGVLATNGKLDLLKKIAKRGLKAVPFVGTALEVAGAVGDIKDSFSTTPPTGNYDSVARRSTQHPTLSEQIVMREVYGRRR